MYATTTNDRDAWAHRIVLARAARISRRLLAEFLEYEEACEADARAGHRPHYCEHGRNLWVDYDPICGACEEGYTMRDGVTRRTVALARSRAAQVRIDKLIDAICILRENRLEPPEAIFQLITDLDVRGA